MKAWILCFLFLLGGCQLHPSAYTLEQWLNDWQQVLEWQNDQPMHRWEEQFGRAALSQPLTVQTASVVIADVLQEDPEQLVDLGYFQPSAKPEDVVCQAQAQSMIQMVIQDLSERTFMTTKTQLDLSQPILDEVDSLADLASQPPGIYLSEGIYYQVSETGSVDPIPLEKVMNHLQVQTTFQPDLTSAVIFPEGTSFQPDTQTDALTEDYHVQSLRSQYFRFQIGEFKVSGRLWSNGMDVRVRKNDFHHMTLDNQLTLSQLKITADIDLNPLKDPHFLLRADYHLTDSLSLTREKYLNVVTRPMDVEVLQTLCQRLNQMVDRTPVLQQGLELLRFVIPVPGSLDALNVEMVLSLQFLLNGEVTLHFESASSQGFQSLHGSTHKIQQSSWQVQPYLDGSAEFGCQLGLNLHLGGYLLADASMITGVGAEGKASVYLVNTEEKDITELQSQASLSQIDELVSLYQPLHTCYIDTCGDIQVYWFIRLGVGNKPQSLLYKTGLQASFTPVKNAISLLHVENHHVVSQCTRTYAFLDDGDISSSLQISDYQLFLPIGSSQQLTVTGTTGTVIWKSSDTHVVTVQDGFVIAHALGTAIVTVQDESGCENQCVIIVGEEGSL